MDNLLLFGLGLLIVAAVSLDILHTTIHVAGSGFLTRQFTRVFWRLVPNRAHWLARAGVGLVMSSVVLWFALFWLGWCLMFAAGDAAVVADPSKAPADLGSLVYFVGFSIITLGIGDYAPNGPLWQVLTVLASAGGFFLVTLIITYLLPVVSAVVNQRQLAAYIHALGRTPQELLQNSWNGSDYSDLDSHLSSLCPMLHQQTYQHLAYPILHYFRSEKRHSAIAPAIAVLNDALLVLETSVSAEQRPSSLNCGAAHRAIADLLETLQTAYVPTADEPPPLPEPVTEYSLSDQGTDQQQQRCVLLGWLRHQSWDWSDRAGSDSGSH